MRLGEDIVGHIHGCDVELLQLSRGELDELLLGMLADMQASTCDSLIAIDSLGGCGGIGSKP